jgi:hypothetical protein
LVRGGVVGRRRIEWIEGRWHMLGRTLSKDLMMGFRI